MITSLTEGKPSKKLFMLALPMIISMLFQQVYNLTDSIIVGNVEGANALSAVGESYLVTMIFMGIAMGFSIGTTVVVSRLFGSKKFTQLKTAIYSSLISMAVLSIFLSVLGAIFSRHIMTMLGADEAFKQQAIDYLNIYFYSLIFVYIYNACNGILNGLGDSISVLMFLIFSSILNIGLDILFVVKFRWGVKGAAWATFISVVLAAILALITLLIKIRKLNTDKKPKPFSFSILKKVLKIALPSMLQHTFISIGNLFVIARLNTFSNEVISAVNVGLKINTVAIACLVTVSNASSSFTAQNLGAAKLDRVKKGFSAGIIIAWTLAAMFFIPFMLFSSQIVNLFVKSVEFSDSASLDFNKIIATGSTFLRVVSPFYFMLCIKIIADGIMRGAEQMYAFLISTFLDLIVRVALTYILTMSVFGLAEKGIFWSWPIGWAVASLVSVIFFFLGKWRKDNEILLQKE